MMSPCGSATRRSTRPSMSRAAARSNASWSRVCAPAERCGCPARTLAAAGLGARHPGGDDQRTAGRGRRPGRARPLGRRSAHRAASAPRSARSSSARTRFTMLIHLPREDGYRLDHADQERARRSPATAPITMKDALAATITTLPEQLRRSLTWDRGKELSAHAAVQGRDRPAGLLRRPAQPLAARHEREHQRPAAPVLPEGHRPIALDGRRARSSRHDAQQPTAQDPRMEDPRRSPRRTPTLAATSRCCVDPLSLVNSRHGPSPHRARRAGLLRSLGTVGDPYDNAVVECLLGTPAGRGAQSPTLEAPALSWPTRSLSTSRASTTAADVTRHWAGPAP